MHVVGLQSKRQKISLQYFIYFKSDILLNLNDLILYLILPFQRLSVIFIRICLLTTGDIVAAAYSRIQGGPKISQWLICYISALAWNFITKFTAFFTTKLHTIVPSYIDLPF
jgi:hypothetical protein